MATLVLILALLAGLAPRAGAVDKYWNPPSDNSWNTAGNWSPSGVPGSADVAIFDGATNNANCTLDAAVNVAGFLLTNGYSGTITQQLTRTITVASSGWRQYSGTFAGGSDTFTLGTSGADGNFILAGGTFTCTSGKTTHYGYFTHTAGGTFNHNNGTYEFVDPSRGCTIDVAASETFNHLTMRATGNGSFGFYDFGAGDTLIVLGVYSNNGVCCGYSAKGGTIESRGNVFVGNYSSSRGLGTVTNAFLVGGDQTIASAGGSFMSMTLSKLSGTLSASGNLNVANFTLTSGTFLSTPNTLQVKGGFTHASGGTFSHNNGTVEFWSGSPFPTYDVAGTETFYHLKMLAAGSGTFDGFFIGAGDTLIVEGVYSNNGCHHRQGTIDARGNVSIGGYDQSGTRGDAQTALKFSGANAQTCAYLGGTKLNGTFTIDKSGGSVTLATDFPLTASGQQLVWTNGVLNLTSNALIVSGATTFYLGATTLGVTVADGAKAGRLTCSNTVSGITNVALAMAVSATEVQVNGQVYTILTNTAVLASPFKSVSWQGAWTGDVSYAAAGGKVVTVSNIHLYAEVTIAPTISNQPPTGVTAGGVTFNGYLASNGSPAAAVYVAWGQTNGAVSGAWATTNWWAAGAWTNGSYPATNMTLSPGANYYYTFGATNSASNVVASGYQYLITGEVTVQPTDPTGHVTVADTAAFTVYRPASCTNEALTVAYTLGGTATNITHYTNFPAATGTNGTVTIPAGQTNAVVTVYPANAVAPDQTVILSLAPGPYAIGAVNVATCTLVAASGVVYDDIAAGFWTNPAVWSPTGCPTNAGDSATINSATVSASAAALVPTIKLIDITRTASTTGTLYLTDNTAQTPNLQLSGGVLQMSGPNGGAKITNSVIRVASNSVVNTVNGSQFNLGVSTIWSEIRDAAGGTGVLTVNGGTYDGTRLYAANTNFTGGWRVSAGLGLYAQTEGALGSGTATVDSVIEVMVDHTNTATRPPPARLICNTGGGVYLNNAFPSYNVTVKDWEIELRGGTLGFGKDGVGTYSGGHVYVVSNSTFYGRRDSRWGTDSRCEAEIVGAGRVTIDANASQIGSDDSQSMRFCFSGDNTNFSGGINLWSNRLIAEHTNALGTGRVLIGPAGSDGGLYFDRPGGNFDWGVANDFSGGRGMNVAITVEDGAGTSRLTALGTVDPGTNTAGIGILRVDGAFAFGRNGGNLATVRVDVASAGTTPGTDHDQLRVDHGDATLAASITNCTLVVSRVPTPTALNGMTLTILVATNADFSSYQFASVTGLGSGGAVIYSNGYVALTWVAMTPVIQNDTYANLAATSCDVKGYLSSTGDTPTEVRCYWGTNLMDKTGWGNTNSLGTQSVGMVSASLTGLVSGATYHYRFYATNGVGEYWSLATSNFTTLADVTWNDAASGNWTAGDANTWGAGLNQYPQFPLNDTVFIDSHTVTVTGAQPTVKATWITRTGSTTGTLYYADASVQTRDLNLAHGVLQLLGSQITNSTIRVSSNSVVNSIGGVQLNPVTAMLGSEIRDATNGTGLLTASGTAYAGLRVYGANTNFTGGWRVSAGQGLYAHTEGALGSGTATVDTAIEVMVDHTNTATRPPPARVICNPGGGVYLNNAFPGYNVTVKDWEIELRGGTLGFGPDGVGMYRGGHVDVVSNSTFFSRRDERWGSDDRIESEIRGLGRVTITATAIDHTTQPLWNGAYMLFRLSGNNTNFSGGIAHLRNRLYVEGANALGTGPLLTAPTDLDSGLYFDRPGGNFDWTVANDISGGRGTNVAITVEDGAGTNTLTLMGTLDPGTNGTVVTTNSTGILRVDGSVAFGAGSRLRIHIAGTNGVAGVDFDRLAVDHNLMGLGNAVLEVNVNTNLEGSALAGQEFVVATNAAALTGVFGAVQWSGLWSGLVTYNAPAGTVKFSNLGTARGTVFKFR